MVGDGASAVVVGVDGEKNPSKTSPRLVVARRIQTKKRTTFQVRKVKRAAGTRSPSVEPKCLDNAKKIKRTGRTNNNVADFNICTGSVPSVGSTEDSDLPDSITSPTDEETCSYITEEELSGGGDSLSVCSDSEDAPATASEAAPDLTPATSEPERAVPSLRFSAFSGLPPYINFCLHDEHVVELPWPIRRYFKWKLSSITPLCVRKTVTNSGFRMIKEPKEWVGTWGKHMKSLLFRLVLPHQKVNHFPGTFQIGRKDRLWRNLQKMEAKWGSQDFGFLPKTFILPHDLRLLRQTWQRGTTDVPWIIKPPASARGTGIHVIHQWQQLPRKRPLVVQSYVQRPYLINGTKFDIRIYVFVTSVDPLRIYLYEDGLVRFASMNYSSEMKSLSDSYVHLTNYSINKNCQEYVANEDATRCQGHKWTLKCLWRYLEERGVDVGRIRASLEDIVVKTLLSVENTLVDMGRGNVANRYQCYELFGFDVLLDEQLKPWLLEVNISPSLHSSSSLDLSVKGPLIRDVFNMARFRLPDSMTPASKQLLCDYVEQHFGDRVYGLGHALTPPGSQYCLDLSVYGAELSDEERQKHAHYEALASTKTATATAAAGDWSVEGGDAPPRPVDPSEILQRLTGDDVRHLIDTEDELSQAVGFRRIFPSAQTDKYFVFMERVRYHNLLLDAWNAKFPVDGDRSDAVEFIEAARRRMKQ